MLYCSTKLKYGKVAAETSRGGKQADLNGWIGFQWTFLFAIMISITGSRADRIKATMSRLLVPLLTILFFQLPLSSQGAALASISLQGDSYTLAVIRGRAVCLNAAGAAVESLLGCAEATSRFGFASKDGRLYKFLPTDTMTAVFTDTRVRQRELQITARLRAGDQLEIIKVQSVKEGKLYDIFYYCEVCSITAYTPGLCPCCRNELEFRERSQ
jgi:hypothetical protein